jgi:hypothetical protein
MRAVQAINALQGLVDEGMVLIEDDLPAYRYRYHFTDTLRLENPQDGTQLEIAIPREEVVFVPMLTL